MGLFDGTELERPVLCDRCGQEIKTCICPPQEEPDVAPQQQRLKVFIEKRKNGRQATCIRGFACRKTQIQALLQKLKNVCGAGGTCDDQSIEIQGNHAETVRRELKMAGYRVQ